MAYARDMKATWRLVVIALFGVAALVAIALLSTDSGGSWVDAGSLEHLRDEGVVYLAAEEVFVVASGDSFVALSAAAPHMEGERVLYCPSTGWFEGQHGEKFDSLGYYQLGPARSGLSRVALRVMDDQVQVNPATLLDTPPRGEGKSDPPEGPFCDGDGEAPVEVEPGFTSVD